MSARHSGGFKRKIFLRLKNQCPLSTSIFEIVIDHKSKQTQHNLSEFRSENSDSDLNFLEYIRKYGGLCSPIFSSFGYGNIKELFRMKNIW